MLHKHEDRGHIGNDGSLQGWGCTRNVSQRDNACVNLIYQLEMVLDYAVYQNHFKEESVDRRYPSYQGQTVL